MLIGRRIAFLGALLCMAGAGCEDDGESPGLKVLTWNLYMGFDAAPLLSASDPAEIPGLAAQAYAQLLATNFPERAAAIAERIASQKPHLVGLQEVALFRVQSPGDAVVGGTTPAEHVFLDHLDVLLKALAARGVAYKVAGKVQNVDIELPMVTPLEPLAFDDIRLTDFDVVLAREDVAVSNVAAANFAAALPLPSLGIEVPRGYVALDASWGPHAVRFVTTHLEDLPFEEIQLAQAVELAAVLAGVTTPVILTGDFNSPAPHGATLELLAAEGFLDAWLRNIRKDQGEGLTWGHHADLKNPEAQFTLRIDLVLVRPGERHRLRQVAAEVWGDDPLDRTPSGLWPSDHGGVSVWLDLTGRRGPVRP